MTLSKNSSPSRSSRRTTLAQPTPATSTRNLNLMQFVLLNPLFTQILYPMQDIALLSMISSLAMHLTLLALVLSAILSSMSLMTF